MSKLIQEILSYTDALYPMIYIHSYEEVKVQNIVKELASDEKKVHEWSLVSSESLEDFLEPYVLDVEPLNEVFIVLKDIHSFLAKEHPQNQKIVAMLKNIIHKILVEEDAYANIILVSSQLVIPAELEKFIAVFEVPLPDYEAIQKIIRTFTKAYDEEISEKDLDRLSVYLKGLTEGEINILLNMAMQNDGRLGGYADEKLILMEKQQIIKKSGILEMIQTQNTLEDIGGLDNLKKWLEKKAIVFHKRKAAKDYGVATPKGVFIVGMPGCGKSLTAKATSILFDNIPLLRLDIGRLMGKYVGESEANMRKAISQAEAISPCILWIDEIEKAFSGIGASGGGNEVTSRLFGFFLTWMQEKTSEVYVVATANDISNLPPELLRKGRFDEVFFVDFPNEKEREQIFKVHIINRKKDEKHIKSINFKKLAQQTKGYSGADIETVVKETIEECFINDKEIAQTQDYLDVIKNITSMSEMLPEKVKEYNSLKEKMKLKLAT
jgi:SpoVK/Ycf46/Vps4 family AAA+-type ATPase